MKLEPGTGKDQSADREESRTAGQQEPEPTGGVPIEQGNVADSGSTVPVDPKKPPEVTREVR